MLNLYTVILSVYVLENYIETFTEHLHAKYFGLLLKYCTCVYLPQIPYVLT